MSSSDNYQSNLEHAKSFIKQAVESGVDWVVLPEVFTFIGERERIYEYAEIENGVRS